MNNYMKCYYSIWTSVCLEFIEKLKIVYVYVHVALRVSTYQALQGRGRIDMYVDGKLFFFLLQNSLYISLLNIY